MGKSRKYVPGDPFETLDELAVWCAQEKAVFWARDKGALPGHFMLQRNFSQVAKAVAKREVRRACRIVELERELGT